MRLTPAERTAIRETVLAVAGTGSRVRLFGSRIDNNARGGDIDLLVELDRDVSQPVRVGPRVFRQDRARRRHVLQQLDPWPAAAR